jgi:tetratricopeptide (TPR) repeat protein
MDVSLSLDINDLVLQLNKGASIPEQHFEAILEKLQDYECWSLYFRLLEAQIDNPKKRQLHFYVRTARAYAVHLEDIQRSAKICVKLLKDLRLSYAEFRERALCHIISEQDFESEAIILQAILPRLRTKEDSVACLERLCLIFEKKKYDELQLNRCYERLIDLEPNNLKALRYFKVVYTQNNQWDKVVSVLQSLFQNAKHINDRYRSAQELAAVYLYQLDQAQNAVDIIEKHCADSPLNTFTIHYEAYFRQQNWEGCLKVLRNYLRKIEGNLNKAIIHYKIGELEEQLKRPMDAEESYLKSLELAPRMLEPLENLIEMHLEAHRWDKVLADLGKLYELVDDPYLKEKVREGRTRLQDAYDASRVSEAR